MPVSSSPHYNQRLQNIRALLNEGKFEEAAHSAQAALDDYPQWVEAWLLMASAREALGSIDEAVFALSEATRHARSLLQRALTNYAYFLTTLGDASEAEKIYKEAITFGGETAGLHYFLARVQLSLGKESEALQHFQRSIELDPDYKEFLANEFPEVARSLGVPVETISEAADQSASPDDLSSDFPDLFDDTDFPEEEEES